MVDTPFDAVLDHAPTAEKHLIETMPGGVALLDFDGDGLLDVFLTGGAGRCRLIRNLGGKVRGRYREAGTEG